MEEGKQQGAEKKEEGAWREGQEVEGNGKLVPHKFCFHHEDHKQSRVDTWLRQYSLQGNCEINGSY